MAEIAGGKESEPLTRRLEILPAPLQQDSQRSFFLLFARTHRCHQFGRIAGCHFSNGGAYPGKERVARVPEWQLISPRDLFFLLVRRPPSANDFHHLSSYSAARLGFRLARVVCISGVQRKLVLHRSHNELSRASGIGAPPIGQQTE